MLRRYSLDTRVRFDVGGQRFETTVATLLSQQQHLLLTLLEGSYKEPSTSSISHSKRLHPIFIDRNPTLFHYIIDFLRKGHVNLRDDRSWLQDLLDEAEYYQLEPLIVQVRTQLKELFTAPSLAGWSNPRLTTAALSPTADEPVCNMETYVSKQLASLYDRYKCLNNQWATPDAAGIAEASAGEQRTCLQRSTIEPPALIGYDFGPPKFCTDEDF